MKRLDQTPEQAWMEARVEAYLDGELPPPERAAFEDRLAQDADWAAELALAQQIQDELRLLPQPPCPPYVAEAVLAEVRRQVEASPLYSPLYKVRQWIETLWVQHARPALAMAVLVCLVVAAALVGRLPQQPGPAEVEQALAEVKWALAYLSEVGRQTGEAVRQDVLEARVVLPVQHALGAVLEEKTNTDHEERP